MSLKFLPEIGTIVLSNPLPKQIAFEAFSQRGTHKSNNEDALLIAGQVWQGRVRVAGVVDATQSHYFAIADGVSSGALPRTASRCLLELLHSRWATDVDSTKSLTEVLRQVQNDYGLLGECKPNLAGMASTLVGVRLIGTAATIFNVGDSRAYLLTRVANTNHVKLLSRDHNFLNDLIDDGEIAHAQSETAASFMHGLTSQFISDPEYDDFKVNVVTHEMQLGERLLLCSDGLTEVMSDTQIAGLLHSQGQEDWLSACKASRRAGGTDDFSVIVLELCR